MVVLYAVDGYMCGWTEGLHSQDERRMAQELAQKEEQALMYEEQYSTLQEEVTSPIAVSHPCLTQVDVWIRWRSRPRS